VNGLKRMTHHEWCENYFTNKPDTIMVLLIAIVVGNLLRQVDPGFVKECFNKSLAWCENDNGRISSSILDLLLLQML